MAAEQNEKEAKIFADELETLLSKLNENINRTKKKTTLRKWEEYDLPYSKRK